MPKRYDPPGTIAHAVLLAIILLSVIVAFLR